MKAITVRQPWAWAIARGAKLVENRSRGTSYRGPLAIHAGASWSDRGAHDLRILTACVRTWLPGPPRPAEGDRPAGKTVEEIAAGLTAVGLREELYGRGPWSRGAVLAIAQLVDSHPDAGCCRPWGESTYTEGTGRRVTAVHHLVLEDVLALAEPIPARGHLGLWTVPDEIAADTWTADLVTTAPRTEELHP